MIFTESKKYPVTRLWLAFLYFTTLLKPGIQDLYSTTTHVNIFKLVPEKISSSEDFSRRNVIRIGHVIANMVDIPISHWPQV